MSDAQIVVRDVQAGDINFIFSTWLRCFRYSSDLTKHLSSDVYYKGHGEVIERVFRRPTTKILVAQDPQDPSVIYGYMVYEDETTPVVHFTYVKKSFRKFGIMKSLINTAAFKQPAVFTHYTFDAKWIMQKYPNLTYNMYLI